MAGAIIHEWIEKQGGSEKVVDSFADRFLDSDIYTLWSNDPLRYPSHRVIESWISKTPLRNSKALALPLLPFVWTHLNPARDYDWMLVSSHLFAHHAQFTGSRNISKFVYTHTPARYIWEPELDSRGDNFFVRQVSMALKPLDRSRAKRASKIAANSNFVRSRIRRCWDVSADVIHPPVDVQLIKNNMLSASEAEHLNQSDLTVLKELPDFFILGASRFVDYKRLDLVIKVGALLRIPVVIAGGGAEEMKLRAIARELGTAVTFVIAPSTSLLRGLYRRAACFLFPAVEDFGIMPVEAMAAGCPAVVLGQGGAQEAIAEGVSGLVASSADATVLAEKVREAFALDRSKVSDAVVSFDRAEFIKKISSWMGV